MDDGTPPPGGERLRPCALCARPASLLCARCLAVSFCDAACQRRAWRDHKPLCVPAATAATALVAVKAAKEAVLPMRRISTLLAEMIARPTSASAVQSCADALYSLKLEKSPKIALTAEEAAFAMAPLVDALRYHVSNVSTCAIVVAAVAVVADTEAARAAALAAHAMRPLVAVLKAHPACIRVCSGACSAIARLSISAAGCEAAHSASASPSIIAALTAHASNGIVCQYAVSAIAALIRTPAGARAVVSAGGNACLLDALRTHLENVILCRSACQALGLIIMLLPEDIELARKAWPLFDDALAQHGARDCPEAVSAEIALKRKFFSPL